MYQIDGLKKVKTLLNIDIEDSSKDFLIEILEDQSVSMIKKYLNCNCYGDEFVKSKYDNALICCIVDLYNNLENKNGSIQSKTQGQRSVSYNTSSSTELSERVKSMLPLPRMRLL